MEWWMVFIFPFSALSNVSLKPVAILLLINLLSVLWICYESSPKSFCQVSNLLQKVRYIKFSSFFPPKKSGWPDYCTPCHFSSLLCVPSFLEAPKPSSWEHSWTLSSSASLSLIPFGFFSIGFLRKDVCGKHFWTGHVFRSLFSSINLADNFCAIKFLQKTLSFILSRCCPSAF